jgi:hypothetical protein
MGSALVCGVSDQPSTAAVSSRLKRSEERHQDSVPSRENAGVEAKRRAGADPPTNQSPLSRSSAASSWRSMRQAATTEAPDTDCSYFSATATPSAERLSLSPCVAEWNRMRTPFWFWSTTTSPPPATVAPAPAETYVPGKSCTRCRL